MAKLKETQTNIERLNQLKYVDLVNVYIRERYSLNDELAILRQRDTKPNEFNDYNTYVEECKARARTEVEE